MKMTVRSVVLVAVLTLLAGLLISCSSGGDGGSYPFTLANGASFNVRGANQLVALSNTVVASGGQTGGIFSFLGADQPFHYRIVNQGLPDTEVRARLKGKAVPSLITGAAGATTGTNLLAVNADGTAELAIDSNYLVKVMYSVTDPKGEFVYLALDTGFVNPDGNDYSPFIAQNDCAFYRVRISDNAASCVKEGVYVQPIDQKYLQTVSSNVKPIQFDSAGNMYFPGTTFSSKCNGSTCSLFVADWKPRIYRMSAADQSVRALTQDNQVINYYLVLNTGEIAYQTLGDPLNTGDMIVNTSSLYVWQPSQSDFNINGTTIPLTGTYVIDFFTVDNYNTILFGNWFESGIRLAKPSPFGGVDKATLETSSLCTQTYGCYNYAPKKVMVGDDGKLYGVFGPSYEEETILVDSDGDPSTPPVQDQIGYEKYKVFQILPYLSVPKVEIKHRTDMKYLPINIWGGTPFQVSKGFLFYKETREKLGYGVNDVINMVNLQTRETITLLDEANTWYEIYSWRTRGDKLYFSALDLARTTVVSGIVDLKAVAQNPSRPQTDYLIVNDMASAIGATSRVQDIEGLGALPTVAYASTPTVQQIFTNAENLNSVSIQFSSLMDPVTTEPAAGIADVTNPAAINSMKVWINNYLHLVPDLDGLKDLASTTPLNTDTVYDVSVAATAQDVSGTPLGATQSKSFRTKPKDGWYIADVDVDAVAKFANSAPYTAPRMKYYDLNAASMPANFMLTFRARNSAYNGVRVVLLNDTAVISSPYSDNYSRKLIDLSLGSWPYLQYQYLSPYSSLWNEWVNTSSYYPQIFNGNWLYYKIIVNGGTISASYSPNADFSGETPIAFNSDFSSRPLYARETGSYSFQLLLGANTDIALDNVRITNYDTGGILVNESFAGRLEGTDGITLSTPALDGTVPGTPDLSNAITVNTSTMYSVLNDWPN